MLWIGAALIFVIGVGTGFLAARRRPPRSAPGSAETADVERRRAEAMLRAAIDQMPEGVIIARPLDVTIHMLNSAALEILGETRQLLVDTPERLRPTHWPTFHPDGTPE